MPYSVHSLVADIHEQRPNNEHCGQSAHDFAAILPEGTSQSAGPLTHSDCHYRKSEAKNVGKLMCCISQNRQRVGHDASHYLDSHKTYCEGCNAHQFFHCAVLASNLVCVKLSLSVTALVLVTYIILVHDQLIQGRSSELQLPALCILFTFSP